MRSIVLLGSTGSIGTQALDVVRRNPARFRVTALAAGGSDVRALAMQAAETSAEVVGVAREDVAEDLERLLRDVGSSARVEVGADAATVIAATPCDVVLNGMTGSIGLAPTLAALDAGRTLALANKESLIVGGDLVRERMTRPDQLVPVDSEHSALAQCLRGGRRDEVRRLVLTASGGPFHGRQVGDLEQVTVEDALAHPTWNMGPVITINSATLINKGLEVIEAHLLFDIDYDAIEVVVHPQSLVHSMVEFSDGSTLAQLSPPDMRLPIALALGWPDRVADAQAPMDWSSRHALTFEPLDDEAFPAVELARRAGRAGGTAPGVLNAANEEAVAGFLSGGLRFPQVVATVSQVLDEHLSASRETLGNALGLADVLSAEAWARQRARELAGLSVAGVA